MITMPLSGNGGNISGNIFFLITMVIQEWLKFISENKIVTVKI